MLQTLYATYDGRVFMPEENVALSSNQRYLIHVEAKPQRKAERQKEGLEADFIRENDDAWTEFFRIGDELMQDEPSDSETITSTLPAMRMKRKPTHPGEIIKEDIIRPLGISMAEAAKKLGVSGKALSALLNCKASLSPDMAIRVGKATDTTPESWLIMQAKFDLWKASQHEAEVEPFIVRQAA